MKNEQKRVARMRNEQKRVAWMKNDPRSSGGKSRSMNELLLPREK